MRKAKDLRVYTLIDIKELEKERVLFDFINDTKHEYSLSIRQKRVTLLKNFFRSYGADISAFAEFSDIPTFPHKYHGIFISQGASVGAGCTIFQQVTIGSNLLIDSSSFGYPIIGKNCYIGVGAKIIGGCKIGDNVRVGANAVIYKDVPSNSVVTGSDMKIFHKENMDNRYYAFDLQNGWAFKKNGKWHRNIDPEVLIRLNKLQNNGNENE